MAVADELNHILGRVRAAIPELNAALVATTDGLPIAHSLNSGDANRLAAMAATALGLGRRICETFGGGEFRETSVSGDQGQMYIYSAGPKAVLGVVARSGANVGLIHLEARDAASQVAQILDRR
ncbi:roadblock/LC7 domain-containing protein [Methylacidimicrobium sp. B4]|uniref:roadblock/LC7 domain-containing protein n=1 Tax=Methylacidimicrobium sp. B4 TaxID=2796139 RepID=UPI001A8D5938|nr:roadblock/LC7 domain-containing protein [Methylacidimicrobium sp. B4]QSR84036.1 roadblock/LC7 domain-containing protein [Methylacidimicrobium sp. B4]